VAVPYSLVTRPLRPGFPLSLPHGLACGLSGPVPKPFLSDLSESSRDPCPPPSPGVLLAFVSAGTLTEDVPEHLFDLHPRLLVRSPSLLDFPRRPLKPLPIASLLPNNGLLPAGSLSSRSADECFSGALEPSAVILALAAIAPAGVPAVTIALAVVTAIADPLTTPLDVAVAVAISIANSFSKIQKFYCCSS